MHKKRIQKVGAVILALSIVLGMVVPVFAEDEVTPSDQEIVQEMDDAVLVQNLMDILGIESKEDLEKSVSGLSKSVSALSTTKTEQEAQIEEYVRELAALTEELKKTKEQVDALNSGQNTLITDYESQLTEDTEKISSLNAKISSLETQISTLTAQIKAVTSTNSSLSSQLAAARNSNSSKNNSPSATEIANAVKQAIGNTSTARTTYTQPTVVQQDNTAINNQISSLKSMVSQLEAQAKNNEAQIQQYKQQAEQAERQAEQARQQAEQVEESKEDFSVQNLENVVTTETETTTDPQTENGQWVIPNEVQNTVTETDQFNIDGGYTEKEVVNPYTAADAPSLATIQLYKTEPLNYKMVSVFAFVIILAIVAGLCFLYFIGIKRGLLSDGILGLLKKERPDEIYFEDAVVVTTA